MKFNYYKIFLLFYIGLCLRLPDPAELYDELERDTPPFCPEYSMGDAVTPFGGVRTPEIWEGGSSIYGRVTYQ